MWLEQAFPEAIYIHWPFCKNKCHYCDFISFEKHESFEKKYHGALLQEIGMFAKSLKKIKNEKIKSIFIGGGTPSLYPLNLLNELVQTLRKNFSLEQLKEFTIESNPADITQEKLKTWKNLGINRLSIGVQVLDDGVLEKLNRFQNKRDVFHVMEIAPKYFKNISVDLILGLPEVSEKTWMQTLQQICSWPVKHVSVYFLTVYEKTPLFFKINNAQIKLISEKEQVKLYEQTVFYLQQFDFEQYEISNFAKSGFESIHNIAYWDRKPYRGFGLSASSFDGMQRFINTKNLSIYLKSAQKNGRKSVLSFFEKLMEKQVLLETLMLGLRQRKGVDLHRVLYLLKNFQKKEFFKSIQILKSKGLLIEEGGKLVLTLKGMSLENEVILKLLDFQI